MPVRTLPLLLLVLLPVGGCAAEAVPETGPCAKPGLWLGHDGKRVHGLEPAALLERLAASQVVLLGETHESAEDHRWQLHTLAQLHARRPDLAVGFEMFPRRLQPVLDRWVAGELSEAQFLDRTEWNRVWGYDAGPYLPLFHYARMNRLPMLALNVERGLVAAVGAKGWDAVPETGREGVSTPAAPTQAYLEVLREVYERHPEKRQGAAGFARFVQAQTVWDRAMAEAIAAHLRRRPDALVVGIVGAGHVRHGHGVAHQLRDLGIPRVANLLTWEAGPGCERFQAGLADAAFVVRQPRADPPRLGIAMEAASGGVRITGVSAGSVAEQAGLRAGDLISVAAGRTMGSPRELRQAVARQAPGTWLPLKVRRGGEDLEIVARFPPER